MELKVLCIILAIFTAVLAEPKNYNGYKVYKVIPQTADDVENLMRIQRSGITEFWDGGYDVNHDVKIMVCIEREAELLEMLQQGSIEAKLVIDDVQRAIDDQLTPVSRKKGSGGGRPSGGRPSGGRPSGGRPSGSSIKGSNGLYVYTVTRGRRRRRRTYKRNADTLLSFTWDRYHTLSTIYSWLDELADTFPDIVKTVVMGESVEGRQIKGIVIDYHPERSDKKIGMFEGGIHAREWISPATVTWIIKEFLASDDPEVFALASSFEWHIFPVVNPDGYSYTFTDRRMWRKNRSKVNSTSCAASGFEDDMSNGVDLNRNFDFVWNSAGTSDDPCSNLFAGPSPTSEPETQAIQQYVLNLKEQGEIIYYIAFHSYTQLVVVPYSHLTIDEALTVSNHADLFEIGMRTADALQKRNGTTYTVGLSTDVMYAMSGTSFDWAKYAADIPVAYLIELRDTGDYGFLLPAEQIIPNNLEIIDGLLEMDQATRDLKYYERSAAGSAISVLTSLIIAFNILVWFAYFMYICLYSESFYIRSEKKLNLVTRL